MNKLLQQEILIYEEMSQGIIDGWIEDSQKARTMEVKEMLGNRIDGAIDILSIFRLVTKKIKEGAYK